MKTFLSLLWFSGFALSGLSAADAPKAPALILIKAAPFVDPVAGEVKDNQAVLIEGDKVKAVGAAADLEIFTRAPGGVLYKNTLTADPVTQEE